MTLHEYVDHFSVLIYSSPVILIAAIDLKVHLIHMPGITNRVAALLQTLGILGTELLAPCLNRLVAHRDTELRHHFLNVAIAQAVPKIEPRTTANNLNWVTMTVIVAGKIHGITPSQIA